MKKMFYAEHKFNWYKSNFTFVKYIFFVKVFTTTSQMKNV